MTSEQFFLIFIFPRWNFEQRCTARLIATNVTWHPNLNPGKSQILSTDSCYKWACLSCLYVATVVPVLSCDSDPWVHNIVITSLSEMIIFAPMLHDHGVYMKTGSLAFKCMLQIKRALLSCLYLATVVPVLPCDSDPCVYRSVSCRNIASGSDYFCTNATWPGVNMKCMLQIKRALLSCLYLATVVPVLPCDSNPCVHTSAACRNIASGTDYFCTCAIGWSGKNCDLSIKSTLPPTRGTN